MPQQLLTDTIRVAIHAPDDITRAGLVSYLKRDQRVIEIPAAKTHEADIVVVVADIVDAATLDQLRTLNDAPDARFLVVAGQEWRADISAAIGCGIRAILWRDTFTSAAFIRALLTVTGGGGSLPPNLQGTLLEQVRRTHRQVLAPLGLSASGLTPRETEVLRLIAEGRELSEIAASLSYSERTVKHTLYSLMKRMNFHTRAQAVSHAIRAGII